MDNEPKSFKERWKRSTRSQKNGYIALGISSALIIGMQFTFLGGLPWWVYILFWLMLAGGLAGAFNQGSANQNLADMNKSDEK
jgi:uncharacterized membrane protein